MHQAPRIMQLSVLIQKKRFEKIRAVSQSEKKLETERCCATIEDRFLICINSMQISFMTATLDGQR